MGALFGTAAGAVSGSGKSGSSGLGYSGQNSSSISTPVYTTAGGNLAGQNWNLGSMGIGNTTGVPVWVWYVAAGVAVLFAFKALRK